MSTISQALVGFTMKTLLRKMTWGDQSRQVTTRCLDQRSSTNCLLSESFAPAWISLRKNKAPKINKKHFFKNQLQVLKTLAAQELPLFLFKVTATVVKEEVHVLG